MVASDKMDSFWEGDFQSVQQNEHLDTETSSVDEISQEQILGSIWVSSHVQDLHQIVVLPVNVSHNGERVPEVNEVSFAL